jgi:AcrR family transcriptional regulator
VEAVGLNELMKHAGFTQGGFYNHFESKADLVAEVLASAMAEGAAELAKSARAPVDESTTALRRYISYYLSRAHRDGLLLIVALDRDAVAGLNDRFEQLGRPVRRTEFSGCTAHRSG